MKGKDEKKGRENGGGKLEAFGFPPMTFGVGRRVVVCIKKVDILSLRF
jgi:hypothetical protein